MAARFKRLIHWLRAPKASERRTALRDQLIFVMGVAILAGGYGYLSAVKKWFPTSLMVKAAEGYDGLKQTVGLKQPWYYVNVGKVPVVRTYQPGKMAPGLTLVTGLGRENHPEAHIIDSNGHVVQRWSINWFKLWLDATHLPPSAQYKSLPGPHTHGVILADNGDLIFNLERAGLFRLDPCGHVRWKLPHMTHHSLFEDEKGNFWVPDMVKGKLNDPALPGYTGSTNDYRLLEVSPGGKILKQWRIFDLFLKNGLESYLYLTSRENDNAHMEGDTLHLNDAEVFPKSVPAGVFHPGDVMLSLRNINMIMVFDPVTGKVRHIFNGPFIRQHDPDFIDGNRITVFDNYNQTMDTPQERSRILELSAKGAPPRILFEGNRQHPFFTNIMGKQQSLSNGGMLLTEAAKGRALEIDSHGNPVWEYRNFVRDGVVGLMDEAQRIDPSMDGRFFARARAACSANNKA